MSDEHEGWENEDSNGWVLRPGTRNYRVNSICIDCGTAGPWVASGSKGLRCERCRLRYKAERGEHYRQTERRVLPPLGRCAICGAREDLTWDHIVPISKGGKSTMSNLRVLCRSCNSRKGNK